MPPRLLGRYENWRTCARLFSANQLREVASQGIIALRKVPLVKQQRRNHVCKFALDDDEWPQLDTWAHQRSAQVSIRRPAAPLFLRNNALLTNYGICLAEGLANELAPGQLVSHSQRWSEFLLPGSQLNTTIETVERKCHFDFHSNSTISAVRRLK